MKQNSADTLQKGSDPAGKGFASPVQPLPSCRFCDLTAQTDRLKQQRTEAVQGFSAAVDQTADEAQDSPAGPREKARKKHQRRAAAVSKPRYQAQRRAHLSRLQKNPSHLYGFDRNSPDMHIIKHKTVICKKSETVLSDCTARLKESGCSLCGLHDRLFRRYRNTRYGWRPDKVQYIYNQINPNMNSMLQNNR